MKTNMNHGMTVEVTFVPKKSKTDKSKYFIYLSFSTYQFGVRQLKPYIISTGICVNTIDWQRDKVKGKGIEAGNINSKLLELQSNAINLMVKLSTKEYKTCNEIMTEIKINGKLLITGKAPKGKHAEIISRLKQYTFESVMNNLFTDRKISIGRQRGYKTGFKLLTQYFNENIPIINLISDSDLINFKKWFLKKHTGSENTATDYLSKIAAVFKYAQELRIISSSPLPQKFRGSWVDGNRQVLSDAECLEIMKIDESVLTKTQIIAKYSLLVQMLTGMGYGDMQSATFDNLKFDNNQQQTFIEKERNKSKVIFKVYATENSSFMMKKLIELTGDEVKPFNLPSIDYMNRQYKEIAKKAGIQINITTYTLRHTYAVNFMDSDGRIEDLAKNLGHKDLRTTQIYGKISNKRLAEKAVQLQRNSIIHQLQPNLNKLKVVETRDLPTHRSKAS